MVSDTGTSTQMMIMPLYIIDAGGTAATIGLFSFLSFLPVLIIYPFAGVIGDRMNRKTIMVVTDLVSAGVILLLAMLAYWDMLSISIMLGAQVIIILMNGMFEPATRGMLPQLVDKEEATKSNSMVSAGRSASIMVGPVIGAALYGTYGIVMVFLANGISFLLSGISEIMIRYKYVKRETGQGVSGILRDLLDGVEFILSNRTISVLCLFYLVNYMMVQPIFSVILPLLFKTILKFSDLQYGYMQMIIIFGALLGSVLVGVLFGKDGKVKVRGPLVWGTGLLLAAMLVYLAMILPYSISLLSYNTHLYFVLLSGVLCLLSVSSTFIIVPIQAYVQKETPNQYMSRVFSLISLLSRGGIPLGALIYGIVLERLALHSAVLLAILVIVVIYIGFVALQLKAQKT
jgi:MFS family permease